MRSSPRAARDRARALLLRLLAGCLFFSLPVLTQAQTASGVRGVVLAVDGSPLRGAAIIITNSSLGLSMGVVTDARGEFRIAPLVPRTGYSLAVSYPNMATVKLDFEVMAGRTTSVPVTLRPSAELRERVRVTAKLDVVDTESTTTETRFGAEFIDSLPILGRNYQDVLTLAPGVTDVNGTGNPSIHGSRDTDVVTLVDGVSTTDPVTGHRGQELNIESIQEIEIKTSGASADYGRAQGGFVNVITKSGGNEFQGKFSFYWRSNILDGQGAGSDDPRLHGGVGESGLRNLKFNDYLPFLSLAGPIKKDKAWYFVTGEYIQKQEPVNALTQAFVRGLEERRIFGKLSWDVHTNQKVVFTATLDPQSFSNEGLDSLTAIESGYTEKLGGLNLVLKQTAILSPSVFLETEVQYFQSRPQIIPNLSADSNHNGILFVDRNHDGFNQASERDPGEDYDRDGAWDVFEDVNHDGAYDPGLDLDQDGRLTPSGKGDEFGTLISTGGCEGVTPPRVPSGAEDKDCDGHLDTINEDLNHNGKLDPGEDIDGDRYLDPGGEDRNHDGRLDDRPFPQATDTIELCGPIPKGATPGPELTSGCAPGYMILGQEPASYPYPHLRPTPPDEDYTHNTLSHLTSGPYYQDYTGSRGRKTLKQDLTVFVPEWHGQHDIRVGGVVERENYGQTLDLREELFPNQKRSRTVPLSIGVALPTEGSVFNRATNTTFGTYFNDTYKPLPNLTFNLGLRFDREATDSFGYTPFDPVAERNEYNSLRNLLQEEPDDKLYGNDDGIHSLGFCSDPIFFGTGCKTNTRSPYVTQVKSVLGPAVLSRLTQHHFATNLAAAGLQALFPEAINADGSVNPDVLRQHGATIEQKEPFRLTNNNLAPRLSVSWDPWGDSRTKLFANWSRFYDKLFLNTVVQEEGPDQILRYYTVDPSGVDLNGIPDNGIGGPISLAPPSAVQVRRDLQDPFSDEFTMGFEREVAPEVSLKVTYINRQYLKQIEERDINHVLRLDPSTGQPLDDLGRLTGGGGPRSLPPSPVPDGRPDLYVENFFFNQIFSEGNFAHARYRGIEVELTKRLSNRWQLEGSYTYSRARGNAEELNSVRLVGDDAASIQYRFGYLDSDMRHVVKFNAATFLPGDWELAGVLSWHSGIPYSIIDKSFSLDNFGYPQLRTLFGQVVAGQSGPLFDPSRRNSQRNPSVYTINVRGQKRLVLGHMNSKLFMSVDNLLNTDDLRIFYDLPNAPNTNFGRELISERRFGRRWELGFQFEF